MLIKVADLTDLWSGERKAILVEGQKVLLINMDGKVYAFENRCAHKGSELTNGKIINGILTCPIHNWEYEVQTGCGVNPKNVKLVKIPVSIINNEIWIEVDTIGKRKP